MKGNWKKMSLLFCTLALVLALVGTSCAPERVKPQEEKLIKVGSMSCLTGAKAGLYAQIEYGRINYFKWLDEQGGIETREGKIKIKHTWQDIAGLIPRGITAYRRFEREGRMLVFTTDTATIETLIPSLVKDEMPLVSTTTLTLLMLTEPMWVFNPMPTLPGVFATFLGWCQETWTEPRPMRVGYIFGELPLTWDGLRIREYVPKRGMEWVGHEVVPYFGLIDTSVEWLRLAGKKPDVIICSAWGAPATTLIMDQARLEIQKKGIKVYNAMWEEATFRPVGEAGEGIYIGAPFPLPSSEPDHPGFKNIFAAAEKYRGWGLEKLSGGYVWGWLSAQIATEGVRLAIEKVGLENVTGREIREGLVSIKDFDVGERLIPPVTMTDEVPFYMRLQRIYRREGGGFKAVSDWIEPPFYTHVPE